MTKKPYPSHSSLPATNPPPVDSPLPPGSHTSTPPLQPHQRRQLRRSQRMVSPSMSPPVPSTPSSVLRRRRSSAMPVHSVPHHPPTAPANTTTTTTITSSSPDETGPYRESLSVEPLSLSRPRPDSTILPGSWGQDGGGGSSNASSLLDPRHFTAVVHRGQVVQYWLPVELVTQGLPGRTCVPRGHWERLVELAEDVRIPTAASKCSGNVQLVTGWCDVQELVENDVEHRNDDETAKD